MGRRAQTFAIGNLTATNPGGILGSRVGVMTPANHTWSIDQPRDREHSKIPFETHPPLNLPSEGGEVWGSSPSRGGCRRGWVSSGETVWQYVPSPQVAFERRDVYGRVRGIWIV
jgi:hypothetical protein